MPGLSRPHDSAEDGVATQGLNKENYTSAPNSLKRQFAQVDNASDLRANGDYEPPAKRQMTHGDAIPLATSATTIPISNGALTNGSQYTPLPGTQDLVQQTLAEVALPPEITHIDQGVVPLSTIWERMAQEAHIQLEELIDDLANLPPSQINGYTTHRNDPNIEKKNRIWDFAHRWRAKFIKLGVLTAWSTNAEAVGKIIDLRNWLFQRQWMNNEQIQWLGELKREMTTAQLPPPDLSTALEILFNGKADWVSNLEYIPPKPATPKEMLQSLKTLNTVLTTRLITQQDLPPRFQDWSVRSGRVTFHVEDEFDLDLAVASEDPASQFFFIDLRFLFSPGGRPSLEGPARAQLEWKLNAILHQDGLQACYDYLHEMVLEHKLSIMRKQARKMAREQWSDHTRLAPGNRGLVVQYWMNRPGKKNWIEIAVSSGQSKGTHLSLRWHRNGVEVTDHGIEIDPTHLSLERILNEVIAQHVNFIFKETKRQLKKYPIFGKDLLSIRHRAHIFDARDCSLKIQLSKTRSLTLMQDVVTGMYHANTMNAANWRLLSILNSIPIPEQGIAQEIGIHRCNTVLSDAIFQARRFGWQMVINETLNNETKARLFRSEKIKYQLFKLPSWPIDLMFVGFTSSLDGDNIWAVELQDKDFKPLPEDILSGRHSKYKLSIQVAVSGNAVTRLDLNAPRLIQLQDQVATIISQQADYHWLQNVTDNAQNVCNQGKQEGRALAQLYVKYPIQKKLTNSSALGQWCTDKIKLEYVGLATSKSKYLVWASGELLRPHPQLRDLQANHGNGLVFDTARKSFMFRSQVALGVSGLQTVDAQMEHLGSLLQFLDLTQRYGFVCESLSLDRMAFRYGPLVEGIDPTLNAIAKPKFRATVLFPESAQLQLDLDVGNPHLEIKDLLNTELNKENGLGEVARLLATTFPLLSSLSEIRQRHASNESKLKVEIVPHSPTSFQVFYMNKTVMLRFNLTIRNEGDLRMHVNNVAAGLKDGVAKPKKKLPAPDANQNRANASEDEKEVLLPEELQDFYKKLVKLRDNDGSWYSLGTGLICEAHHIISCLDHLDNAIASKFSEHADAQANMRSPPASTSFKPDLGQAPGIAAYQAQQRAGQGFNAPPANMAQMRSGAAPPAKMQANMAKRPQQQLPTPSPPKQNSGQSKNQPITLE